MEKRKSEKMEENGISFSFNVVLRCTFSERLFLDVLSPASSQDSQRGLLHTETESIREIASQAGLEQNPVNLNGEPQSGADKIEGTQLDDSSTILVKDCLHCLVELLSFHERETRKHQEFS